MSKLSEMRPSRYGYEYQDWGGQTVIRFNGGGEVNGAKPTRAIGFYSEEQVKGFLRAHETGASGTERMRERAALVLDLDADDQSTSADEWHQKMERTLRRLADAIRALPTDGE